jgi:hypothetical protein
LGATRACHGVYVLRGFASLYAGACETNCGAADRRRIRDPEDDPCLPLGWCRAASASRPAASIIFSLGTSIASSSSPRNFRACARTRQIEDGWDSPIQEWLGDRTDTSINEILNDALFISIDKIQQRDANRIAACPKRLDGSDTRSEGWPAVGLGGTDFLFPIAEGDLARGRVAAGSFSGRDPDEDVDLLSDECQLGAKA